jgi:hypothetical protein
VDSILPACFIICWYKFTTASILAKNSGERWRVDVRQDPLHAPIPHLTHRDKTDKMTLRPR